MSMDTQFNENVCKNDTNEILIIQNYNIFLLNICLKLNLFFYINQYESKLKTQRKGPTYAHDLSDHDHIGSESWIIELLMFHQKAHNLPVNVRVVKTGLLRLRELTVDVHSGHWVRLGQHLSRLYVCIMDLSKTQLDILTSEKYEGSMTYSESDW